MKKLKHKKLLTFLAIVLAVCLVGIGIYFIARDKAYNRKALRADYTEFATTDKNAQIRGLVEVVHSKYTTGTSIAGETRLTVAYGTLSEMDAIAKKLSPLLTFGTGDENGAQSLDASLTSLIALRAEYKDAINLDINNLNNSTMGSLGDGYNRLFNTSCNYIKTYAKFMQRVCDYVKDYYYNGNAPAEIAVYDLYFNVAYKTYNNIEPSTVSLRPAHKSALDLLESKIGFDSNFNFKYNSSLSSGQYSAECFNLVEKYYSLANRLEYASNLYSHWQNKVSADSTTYSLEVRTTYYLSKVLA